MVVEETCVSLHPVEKQGLACASIVFFPDTLLPRRAFFLYIKVQEQIQEQRRKENE